MRKKSQDCIKAMIDIEDIFSISIFSRSTPFSPMMHTAKKLYMPDKITSKRELWRKLDLVGEEDKELKKMVLWVKWTRSWWEKLQGSCGGYWFDPLDMMSWMLWMCQGLIMLYLEFCFVLLLVISSFLVAPSRIMGISSMRRESG
jgi:hypothetical protein